MEVRENPLSGNIDHNNTNCVHAQHIHWETLKELNTYRVENNIKNFVYSVNFSEVPPNPFSFVSTIFGSF